MTNDTYWLYGGNASPYSRKLRAILRYRRLPHVWRLGTPDTLPELAGVRPRIVPVLRLPEDGSLHVDSTPLAYRLEQRHAGQRSILPPDATDAFVCHLIEDFADEWGTKLMFHHRWQEDATAAWAARWIVGDAMPGLHGKSREQAVQMFHDRQRGRCALVGSTPENAPLLEASYRRLLDILGPYVCGAHYLFGSRPSLADFALYGQLAQLVFDPWPQRICREQAPAVEAWVTTLDDASGIDGEWQPESGEVVREALLAMAGAEYLPFLQANAQALEEGRDRVEVDIRGHRYVQQPFGYQVKCYAESRRRWAALDAAQQAVLTPLLERTGWLEALSTPQKM